MPSRDRPSAPLRGQRVIVTRARAQADSLSTLLKNAGAEVLAFPTLRIVPPEDWQNIDACLEAIDSYDMILLGSANAALVFGQRAHARGQKIGVRVGCVGEKTAALLKIDAVLSQVYVGPHTVPTVFRAEALAQAVIDTFEAEGGIQGRRFLFPRGLHGRTTLLEALASKGAKVTSLEVYRAIAASAPSAPLLERIRSAHVVTFLSGETLSFFLEIVPDGQELLRRLSVAVIGPVAKARAEALGVRVDMVAEEATAESLVNGISKLRRST